jgi:hypothetical protein
MLFQLAEHGRPPEARFEAEQTRKVGVKLHQPDRAVAQVQRFVQTGRKAVGQEPEQTAFSAAGLSGHQANAAGFHQQLRRREVTLDRRKSQKLGGRDFLAEWRLGQSVEAQIFAGSHQNGSCSVSNDCCDRGGSSCQSNLVAESELSTGRRSVVAELSDVSSVWST